MTKLYVKKFIQIVKHGAWLYLDVSRFIKNRRLKEAIKIVADFKGGKKAGEGGEVEKNTKLSQCPEIKGTFT